jgi:two-component sensor histidine kinase
MQGKQSSEPAVHDALEEIQNRIKAISKVHQRLYTRGDLTTIDLDAYLENLVDDLRESLPFQVAIDLRGDPVLVSPDTGVSVGVIVNELVSNAAKYAFKPGQQGRIGVRLEATDGGGFVLTVEDDGHGIDRVGGPVGTGLGTRIINAIARSLGSKAAVLDRPVGTAVRISVKGRSVGGQTA